MTAPSVRGASADDADPDRSTGRRGFFGGRNKANRPSIWSRGFIIILVINLVINVAQYMMIAVVPTYAATLGASAVVIGVVTGVFAVTALAVRPFVGPATFRFPNQVLLAVTTAIILAAFVCYAFAGSVEIVVIGRLLHGVGMGLLAPVALVLASDALPVERMASGIGIFSLGQAVAMAAGPSAGLALVAAVGYRATFLISAGVMMLALLLSLLVTSTPPVEDGRFRFSWNRIIAPEALPAAIVIFFLAGAYSAVNAFIVVYGNGLGIADIGLFFTAYALTMLLARPIAGRAADRFGLASVVIPGMVLFAASFFLIASARSLPEFLIAGVVSSLGYGVCQPAIQSLALLSVTKERRGVAGSTNYMGVDLAYLIMPIAAGFLVSSGQTAFDTTVNDAYSLMFRAMVIPVCLGLAVFVTVTAKKRRDTLQAKDAQ